jgi:ABC-type glutathione transport system ATPase component
MGGRVGKKTVPHGAIGQQIFDEVERLTAQGAMTRLAAFKQIAESSGRQHGTVAANFYRIARKRGVALRPRRSSATVGQSGSGRVMMTLRALERLRQEQEEEIARLRKENARFAQLRRLLA